MLVCRRYERKHYPSEMGSGAGHSVFDILRVMTEYRKRLRRFEDGRIRFVTFSTYRRLPLFENDTIRDHFATAIADARERVGFDLFAWVIMPEHVHLVLWCGEKPIAPVLGGLKSGFAKSVLTRWRMLNAPILASITDDKGVPRFWQRGGGYDRNIRDADEFREKIAYIHANPVRRGLVISPADWQWSSARWYEGDTSGTVPIDRP